MKKMVKSEKPGLAPVFLCVGFGLVVFGHEPSEENVRMWEDWGQALYLLNRARKGDPVSVLPPKAPPGRTKAQVNDSHIRVAGLPRDLAGLNVPD
ncbi:hypothetical protein NBRC116587_03470 [Pseudoteredinibacter isoporae]